MTLNGWIQILLFLAAIAAVTVPLGAFMARVFARERTWLDPVLRPLERLIYRLTGVDETARDALDRSTRSRCWRSASSRCWCSTPCSACRALLPLNPQGLAGVAPDLAFNTAASFTTNTNWQSYVGETTMSYLTQMAGLAYHNFVSAAVGIALAIAFIRGIAGERRDSLGNFWVDMTRATLWVLLPFCVVGALLLVSQGVVQNLKPYDRVQLVDPQTTTSTVDGKETTTTVTEQVIAQGPVASQEIIKEWGTNGGGFFNANSAHPFENPTPLSNFIEMFAIFAISAGLTYTLGRMTKSPRHGWAVWAAMAFLFLAGVTVAYWAEAQGNPLLAGTDQTAGRDVPGRQHGRQGGALRHRQLGAVRDRDDRRQLRRGQLDARLVHAARRHGAARQHDARRSDLRRRRRRHVRHPDLRRPVGLHRRADGRPHAGVSRARRSRPSTCRWRCSPCWSSR